MLKLFSLAAFTLVLITNGAVAGVPGICGTAAPAAAETPMAMPMGAPADEAHAALMAGMDAMNRQMAVGMAAKDIDVAFICGMLPHHAAAIDMARAELRYGNDPWVKALAGQIIDAQTGELAAMREWLSRQPAD